MTLNWILGIVSLAVCTPMMVSAQYLEPLGDGARYGCGVADRAGKVFEVIAGGIQRAVKAGAINRLIEQGRNGSALKRKLARDLQKCRRRTLTTTNACDAIATSRPPSAGEVNAKIVNGRLCTGEVTSVVLINTFADDGSAINTCSGVMVAPNLAITAAHCLHRDGLVAATSAVMTTPDGDFPATHVGFHGMAAEPKPAFWFYDIGFVYFFGPPYDTIPTGVRYVDIIGADERVEVGERALIAGYGRDESGFGTDLIAGFTRIAASDNSGFATRFTGAPGESSTCNGDSGGPLLVKRGDQWVLAGVVSYGHNSCATNLDYYHSNLHEPELASFLADTVCWPIIQNGRTCPFPFGSGL